MQVLPHSTLSDKNFAVKLFLQECMKPIVKKVEHFVIVGE